MLIKRYFSTDILKRIKGDFEFLINFINSSLGEFDFAIRDNYFNIYYKGNSLAKVEPKINDLYKVYINEKFFINTKADNSQFYISKKGTKYISLTLNVKQLRVFFQRKHILEFASRIKRINYGEEIDFEQSLITDNLNRKDLIFIDRQVTDTLLKGRRLDLLALKKNKNNKYNFLVGEVKLGCNTELVNKVAPQLEFYVEHINKYFTLYKKCYETHFYQKKKLGLLTIPSINMIDIIKPVMGIILVGGYSGIAKKYLSILKRQYPNLSVKQFKNVL